MSCLEFSALWGAVQQGHAHVAQIVQRSEFSQRRLADALRVAVWNDHAGTVTLLVAAANARFPGWNVANHVDLWLCNCCIPLQVAALRDSTGAARAPACQG